jgi:sodium-dependent phosphate transporter
MMCAMIGSSFWVLGATRMSMPVSTTHAIVGAVMGMGIACFGFGSVDWGWDGVGMVLQPKLPLLSVPVIWRAELCRVLAT